MDTGIGVGSGEVPFVVIYFLILRANRSALCGFVNDILQYNSMEISILVVTSQYAREP